MPHGPRVFAAIVALRRAGPMHDSMMRMFACTFQLSPKAALTSSDPAAHCNVCSLSSCSQASCNARSGHTIEP